MIDVIGFDGDDTLWHNESIFHVTQERFRSLLAPYKPKKPIDEHLLATEMRNLRLFGYGIKGFTLSMIETAIQVTEGQIRAADIQHLIDEGKWMLDHPVELLNGVRATVEALAADHRLILITKGDLFDQESKIARAGLGDWFWRIEIVSEKDTSTYQRILDRHDIDPARFLMVGNSMRSDVLPVLAIGARAAHIPYHLTWQHEAAARPDVPSGKLVELASIAELRRALDELKAGF